MTSTKHAPCAIASRVGYAQSPLDTDYGAVMACAQFADVSASDGSVSLSSLVPVAGVGVDTAYGVNIQILDNGGYSTESDYMWNGSSWENTNTGAATDDVTFSAGQGLWVMSFVGEPVGFQSAGRVQTSDLNVALDTEYGGIIVGNAFPTSVSLSDILPVADKSVDTAYSVNIQILDNGGYTTDADYMWNGTSWEDTNTGAAVTDVTFAPGQGLWVMNFSGEAVSLYIPAPEL